MAEHEVPQSPEEYPEEVREALDQRDISHDGGARKASPDEKESMDQHMGARDSETSSVTPPMVGPSKLTEGPANESGIDPHEELTGG